MTDKPPRIIFFYCVNSLDNEEFKQCFNQNRGIDFHRISLPCSGKVDLLYLLKAIEKGANGVILMACRRGECCYLEGNLRAKKRVEAVDSLLEEAGLGTGHITIIQPKDGDRVTQVIKETEDFCKKFA